eukprot:TRINITY_DN76431_c0_g1_i1.p2 TRINITY_DN76431_c0_g1~~TRINITY_DN76431_c0_g1_i1.p2  ORF type:complete len:187 (+),score=58.91 TRINITY_DN76431_c0_g1_i1:316-876(+)
MRERSDQHSAGEAAMAERNPRGRPRKYSEETLIDAALQVMEREGFAALTIRSLAQQLGTSHTTLYNYLDSIEEIESKAVHKLAAQLPSPGASTAAELRMELKEYMLAARKLLLQHPGVMLSDPESAAARSLQDIGNRWFAALLPYSPDMKTVQLAIGALLATALMSEIGRAVQQECRDRSRMPSSA